MCVCVRARARAGVLVLIAHVLVSLNNFAGKDSSEKNCTITFCLGARVEFASEWRNTVQEGIIGIAETNVPFLSKLHNFLGQR